MEFELAKNINIPFLWEREKKELLINRTMRITRIQMSFYLNDHSVISNNFIVAC